MQFALPGVIRRAFRNESECRMQVHETTRPQPHKTTGATYSPAQALADRSVANLRRNSVDLNLVPAPSRTAPLAQYALENISEK